jgi:hypothetical protein
VLVLARNRPLLFPLLSKHGRYGRFPPYPVGRRPCSIHGMKLGRRLGELSPHIYIFSKEKSIGKMPGVSGVFIGEPHTVRWWPTAGKRHASPLRDLFSTILAFLSGFRKTRFRFSRSEDKGVQLGRPRLHKGSKGYYDSLRKTKETPRKMPPHAARYFLIAAWPILRSRTDVSNSWGWKFSEGFFVINCLFLSFIDNSALSC